MQGAPGAYLRPLAASGSWSRLAACPGPGNCLYPYSAPLIPESLR